MGIRIAKAMAYAVETHTPGSVVVTKSMAYAVETFPPGSIQIAKAMAYATEGTTPRPVAPFTRKRREARQFFP